VRSRDLRFAARTELSSRSLTLRALRLLRGPSVIVSRDADACIEGFIRSGNTFAFHAFRLWNPDAEVAHHTHAAGQLRRAVRLGVPCAVLVRNPLDTISSLMIFTGGTLSPGTALRGYIRYYSVVAELRPRLVVCTFDEIVGNPSIMVERLNRAFDTSFQSKPMDEAGKRDLLETIERYHRNRARQPTTYSVPSAEKERLKEEVKGEVAAHPKLSEATALCDGLMRTIEGPPARAAEGAVR
jgi:hypothetical protein